jgi:hypothetical protein
MTGRNSSRACAAGIVVAVAAAAGAGCGDDPACIEGVCPDFEESRSLPGPCRAGLSDEPSPMTFDYDAAGRVTRAGRMYLLSDEGPAEAFMGAEWSYDVAGAPSEIRVFIQDSLVPGAPYTWTFDDQEVRKSGRGTLARYDREAFAFLPLVGRALASPGAELGLFQESAMGAGGSSDISYTWEVMGSRRIRRQVPDGSGGPLEIRTYELDERGRILSIAIDREPDGVPESTTTFAFDGDRLIGHDDMTWTYDLGGNVVEGRSADGSYREVYAYDCW